MTAHVGEQQGLVLLRRQLADAIGYASDLEVGIARRLHDDELARFLQNGDELAQIGEVQGALPAAFGHDVDSIWPVPTPSPRAEGADRIAQRPRDLRDLRARVVGSSLP